MDKPKFYFNKLLYDAVQWLAEVETNVDVTDDNHGTVAEIMVMDNECYHPEVIYYKDGFDIVTGSLLASFNDEIDELDFSACKTATQCVMLEAQALVDAAMVEVCSDLDEWLRKMNTYLGAYTSVRNFSIVDGSWEVVQGVTVPEEGWVVEDTAKVWIDDGYAFIEVSFEDPDGEAEPARLVLRAEVVKLGRMD